MTIRQYWMKYVAPQGSPLATFQPRPMGGPRAVMPQQHPAMRGLSPRGGGPVMRGSRGGGHTIRRGTGGLVARGRGRGGMIGGMKDSIVIGEVFSVNGGAEQQQQDDYDYGEVRLHFLMFKKKHNIFMNIFSTFLKN